jgi:hypothetical protein
MNRHLLFIIRGDPRVDPRPAEALRIAAGVGAWKKVEITIFLSGAAVLALSDASGEFVDEEVYRRYLPILAQSGRPIYVPAGAPAPAEIGESGARFEEISDQQLANLAAECDSVAQF